MNKKNRGFTLIELLIAIAVLSTMAGVLFQTFVVSRRIDAKARKEEVVQDAARKTLEELKGYSFKELEKKSGSSEAGKSGNVTIAGTEYTYEPLADSTSRDAGDESWEATVTRDGFLLKREYPTQSGNPGEKADYVIYAEADHGVYGKTDSGGSEESAYSINRYQMPNIADVSSFQNVVIDPQMLTKDDEVWSGELLAMVNPEEEEEKAEAEEAAVKAEGETVYDKNDIRKFLHIEVSETNREEGGETQDVKEKLIVRANAIYTVSEDTAPGNVADFDNGSDFTAVTKNYTVSSFKKQIEKEIDNTKDESGGAAREKTASDPEEVKTLNRIYLFLPAFSAVRFEKIYVTVNTKNLYETYVILQDNTESMTSSGFISVKKSGQTGVESEMITLHTNIGTEKPVSLYKAEARLYHLTVTVYEADYGENGDADKATPGEELLRLDSSKTD